MNRFVMSSSLSSVEFDIRSSRLRPKDNFVADARHAVAVDDEEHVNPRYRLSRQLRRHHAQLSFARGALLMERELHIPIAGREAMRVMVAAKHHDRGDLIQISGHRNIE